MQSLTQARNRGAQESVSENARIASAGRETWSYTPGAYPALDRELEHRAAMGGAVWSPHLVGQSFISFGDFLQRAEVLEYLNKLFPAGSDQAFALRWLRERSHEFVGDRKTGRAKLTTLIRECPLLEARGYATRDLVNPLIADDADVTVMAGHIARFAIDTLLEREPSMFPVSAYMIGLAAGWEFNGPFETYPIELGTPVPATEPVYENTEKATAELGRILALFKDKSDEAAAAADDRPAASA